MKGCFWLLALIAKSCAAAADALRPNVNGFMSLSGRGLQSSLLVEVLVAGSEDACLAIRPSLIINAVSKLTHPKHRCVHASVASALFTLMYVCAVSMQATCALPAAAS